MKFLLLILALLLGAGGSGWALWFFVANIDPVAMDLVMWLAVYGLAILAVGCAFMVVGLLGRRFFGGPITPIKLKTTLRQSAILAVVLASFLGLQQFRQLTWWSGGPILLIAIVLEALIQRREANKA